MLCIFCSNTYCGYEVFLAMGNIVMCQLYLPLSMFPIVNLPAYQYCFLCVCVSCLSRVISAIMCQTPKAFLLASQPTGSLCIFQLLYFIGFLSLLLVEFSSVQDAAFSCRNSVCHVLCLHIVYSCVLVLHVDCYRH